MPDSIDEELRSIASADTFEIFQVICVRAYFGNLTISMLCVLIKSLWSDIYDKKQS